MYLGAPFSFGASIALAAINGARLWHAELGAPANDAPTSLFHHDYTASRVNWCVGQSTMPPARAPAMVTDSARGYSANNDACGTC